MNRIRIKLMSPQEVEEFVNIASAYEFDIDLVSGAVYIDAKSFLGVMTMGFKRELEVCSMADDRSFRRRIQKFAVA